MKLFTKGFLLLLVMSALFVKCDCGSDDPAPTVKTVIEQISRDWALTAATKNGANAGFAVESFSLTLRESVGAATTFAITVGASPATPSPGGLSGNWTMNSSFTQINFLAGTANENTVTVMTATETALKISWIDLTDKTEPTYVFTFKNK